MITKSQRIHFGKLFINFIHQSIIVDLFDNYRLDRTFFHLLDKVIEPAIVEKRLWWLFNVHGFSYHLGPFRL